MDDRGYSLRVMRANEQADPSSTGVLLGRICIKKEIPVVDVADFFGVSRMTIYSWFPVSVSLEKSTKKKYRPS